MSDRALQSLGRRGQSCSPHRGKWAFSTTESGAGVPGQLQHWQLDRSTDWLSGVKEARELHPGTWCSGVKKAGFKPGKGIRDKNREGGSSQNKSLKTLHAVKVISSVLYLLNFSSSKTYCKHYCTYLGKRSARNIFNWAARAFPGFANISSSMCIAIKRWRHVVEG